MNDMEFKEKQEKLKEQYSEFIDGKVGELGADGFMEFWMDNLNNSINELENPTGDIENYFKNLDPIEYEKDPQKFVADIQNELKRQREEYGRVLKEYKEKIDEVERQYIKAKKRIAKKDSDIIKLNSILPDNHIIPNTKINNFLDKIIGNGNVEVNVGGNKKEILTIINIDYESKDITLPKSFTSYDRTVLNACISLFEASNECFTVDMVYRCMNGLTDSEKPTPQQKGAITKSLDKMRFLYCNIDFTAEAKARKGDTTKAMMESYILNSDKVTLEAGGNEVIGYKFNTKPILYQYAQQSKQIISIPIGLLNTKNALSSTDEVIVIREYLIRRIETMKNTNGKSNKILFDSIYQEIGLINKPTKQKADKIRTSVKKILDYWKSEKYIKGYNEYKEGRTFRGIEIIY